VTDLAPGSPFVPRTLRDFVHVRAARDDYWQWLHHVAPAGGCTQPIRLAGAMHATIDVATGQILSSRDTADLPDGVLYKACGNRRESVCPSCAHTYQRDAYQLVRAGLVGGKGVPEEVATHSSLFVTFTAPGFGPVHTRAVTTHTCTKRRQCDCRPKPCHPGRGDTCPHGEPAVCFARHDRDDPRLGQPLCLDCYDHHRQAVWNNQAGELWRRTTMAITRTIRRTAKSRGIDPKTVKVSYGKVAEMQRRAVIHFHAVIRLDGADPTDPTAILPPPQGIGHDDLVDAVQLAATNTMFMTPTHPDMPSGWLIAWGTQLDIRPINLGTDGAITDGMVAGYLAKYASKATEATGHTSRRLTAETIDIYADPDGTHTQRLVEACWVLGRFEDWARLRNWSHMLGFGGHFLTKSRYYSVTFRLLREERAIWQRTQNAGPEPEVSTEAPTVLVVNFLEFVGAGWHNPGDAMLANTAAAMAREQRRTAREELATALAA
jgi:hypothetical protein